MRLPPLRGNGSQAPNAESIKEQAMAKSIKVSIEFELEVKEEATVEEARKEILEDFCKAILECDPDAFDELRMLVKGIK
jgi:restriction endonuclease Mrr